MGEMESEGETLVLADILNIINKGARQLPPTVPSSCKSLKNQIGN